MLSAFSKIFEKLVYSQLYKFLDDFEIFYPLQFGFRENHSTIHALLCLSESIKQSIDNGRFGCGVFLDLQKAIDIVNHSILLQKLEHHGIRGGNALDWFQSYLTRRLVLGPLLFSIYVNDLANVSKVLEFYLFADDTSIYFDSNDLITLQKTVNKELRKVEKWLDANRLALNITKTNYVIFHSPSKVIKQFIRIKLGSKFLNCAEYIKYLGILVDST